MALRAQSVSLGSAWIRLGFSFLSAGSTFCGLLLGLVAVSAWRAHSDAASLVTHEATTLAALYRDIGDYPEPTRSELRKMAKDYVTHTDRKSVV